MKVEMYGTKIQFERFERKHDSAYADKMSGGIVITAETTLPPEEIQALIKTLAEKYAYVRDVIKKHNEENPEKCNCWKCHPEFGRGEFLEMIKNGQLVGASLWHKTYGGAHYQVDIDSVKNTVSFVYRGSERQLKGGCEYAVVLDWYCR